MGTTKSTGLLCPFKAGQPDDRCIGSGCACSVTRSLYRKTSVMCGLVPERDYGTPAIVESYEEPRVAQRELHEAEERDALEAANVDLAPYWMSDVSIPPCPPDWNRGVLYD